MPLRDRGRETYPGLAVVRGRGAHGALVHVPGHGRDSSRDPRPMGSEPCATAEHWDKQ